MEECGEREGVAVHQGSNRRGEKEGSERGWWGGRQALADEEDAVIVAAVQFLISVTELHQLPPRALLKVAHKVTIRALPDAARSALCQIFAKSAAC